MSIASGYNQLLRLFMLSSACLHVHIPACPFYALFLNENRKRLNDDIKPYFNEKMIFILI
jgi:hypothetical protein